MQVVDSRPLISLSSWEETSQLRRKGIPLRTWGMYSGGTVDWCVFIVLLILCIVSLRTDIYKSEKDTEKPWTDQETLLLLEVWIHALYRCVSSQVMHTCTSYCCTMYTDINKYIHVCILHLL